MTLQFLFGALLGSAFAIFGVSRPLRRALQEWRGRNTH